MLPVWLAWASLVFALGLLIFPIGWAVLIFGVPLWTVVVSVLLWRRVRVGDDGGGDPRVAPRQEPAGLSTTCTAMPPSIR